jgi:hypothetical protein
VGQPRADPGPTQARPSPKLGRVWSSFCDSWPNLPCPGILCRAGLGTVFRPKPSLFAAWRLWKYYWSIRIELWRDIVNHTTSNVGCATGAVEASFLPNAVVERVTLGKRKGVAISLWIKIFDNNDCFISILQVKREELHPRGRYISGSEMVKE